jgi:PAS domain S-box-containing protein
MNHSPCILVVDDNPLVLHASSRILRDAGYTVIEASSGAECLRLAREHTPDLILLDVVIDEPNGMEICRQLKADPALARSFVILFSGIKTESDDQAAGIEAGADGYITRPISKRELVARVQGMLRIKAAEDALRAISARYQTMLAAIPDIIMEVDKNKVYTWANEAGYAFFGKDVIGKPADYYFEGDQDTYHIVQPLFNGKHEDIIYVESWQRRQDGEKRLLAWWCRTLRDAYGNVIGALSTARDITEQRRAQAALQEYSERLEQMVEERTRELRAAQEQLLQQERLALLGQIASGIGHELRGPLSTISNAVYLLRQILPTSDEATREALDILTRQVEASNRIITSLLTFARPQPPVRRPTDVRAVIDAALAQAALPNTIVIRREFDDTLPEVQADADQLLIVFSNLIRNAVQAMGEHGGTLTISGQRSTVSGQPPAIEIRITDTGTGIPPEIRDKLFQPFFTTKSRGLGLGLALCKLIVEAHGGTIAVESIAGKGTTFTVTLPVEQ